jgi:hypothetical protein
MTFAEAVDTVSAIVAIVSLLFVIIEHRTTRSCGWRSVTPTTPSYGW